MLSDKEVPSPTQEQIDKAEKMFSAVRLRVLKEYPFFGHLLLKMQLVITNKVPMAAVTASRQILINPEWITRTTPGEVGGTLVHEVLHPAYLVFERQGDRKIMAWSPQSGVCAVWNLAHDYCINLIIEDSGASWLVPPSRWRPAGLLDRKYTDWSAEEVYEDIIKNANDNSSKGKKDKSGGAGCPAGAIFIPDLPEGVADVIEGKVGENGTQQPMSPGEGKEQTNFWKQAFIEAVQHHMLSKDAGKLPAGVRKRYDELVDPKVSWRDVLSRWVGENGRRGDYSYQRPSRRSESVGEILPSIKKHGVDDIVVLWDTSGSMNGRETEIFSEVIGICEDLGMSLRVICVDCAICSDQSDVTAPDQVDVRGGGGSDFTPAFARLEHEQYEGIVVAFTDGYIGVPTMKPMYLRDCLWVIWEGDHVPTNAWGEVLRIKNGHQAK